VKVKELMVRDVRTCQADDDLNRPAQIMWETDCGTVPVVDAAGIVKGMITDRDICMAAYTKGRCLDAIHVRSTMAREIAACSPEDTLEAALATMRKARVRRLPVTERNGRLVGILSLNDLAREASREVESGGRNPITAEFTVAMGAICERTVPASGAKREPKSTSRIVNAGS